MEPQCFLKQIIFTTLLLGFVIFCYGAQNCQDDPVGLDEHFFGCCKGRPKYTSEPCIDAILENDTFSEECILDCMYKEFEVYNGEVIDLTAVKTFLDSQVTDEDFSEMYMNAFEICSKFDKKSIESKFSFINNKNKYGCDEYPIRMEFCIWYHTIANCPEKYVTNDETCNNKREWVNECLF